MALRILTVDDNEIVGWTLSIRLWTAGYEVQTAASAAEGLERLRTERYDLVLLDLDMPDMNGLEALETIVGERLCPTTPIVLLTSSDDTRNIIRAKELGASGYLTKDYAIDALTKSVDRLVRSPDTIWLDDHHWVSRTRPQAERAPVRPNVVQLRTGPLFMRETTIAQLREQGDESLHA